MALPIKHVDKLIEPMLDQTTWRNIPSFPWNLLEKALHETLDLPSLSLQPGKFEWRSHDHLLEGMGDDPFFLKASLSPLEGEVTIVIPEVALRSLSRCHDLDLQKNFMLFALLGCAKTLDDSKVYDGITPQVGAHAVLPEEGFAADIGINHEETTSWVRIIYSPQLQQSVKGYFVNKPTPEEVKSSITLPCSLEVGATKLTHSEWESVRVGDFVLLDQCSYNPETKKGTMLLTLQGNALFHIKQKDDGLKILDIADYQEGELMNEEPTNEELVEEEAAPSPQEEKLLPPKDIPLVITVEVGKLSLTYEKLTSLQPGSTLELGMHPEQHVTLSINGAPAGRGELVQVGEMIGVKILELG